MSQTARPDEVAELLLDKAEAALDEGDPDAALSLCEQAMEFVPGHPGIHYVCGDAYRMQGRVEDACEAYRHAALGRPDHASSWASYGLMCFELLRWDDCRIATDRAIREDPSSPEGWWVRALLLEREGNTAAKERALTHARWLDPAGYPLSPRLTDDEVDALITEALSELHPTIREYLANVAILLEDVPPDDVLTQYDPPMSPLELLGYFSGHSLMERSMDDPWSQLPGTIVIFRSNLERQAFNRPELVQQLRITFFHEVGHFLGLDERDLEERGLD